MISYIKGEVIDIKLDKIIIENNNIGYNIFVPTTLINSIPGIGREIKIYTYMHVREDAMNLFGFLSQEDLEFFKALIQVNGVGPKAAIKILSGISPDDLKMAVISDDVKTVSSAPGVGKKTAEKIIIELKDKFSISEFNLTDKNLEIQNSNFDGDLKFEVVSALAALGYSDAESLKAVKKAMCEEITDVETLLKESLKIICSL